MTPLAPVATPDLSSSRLPLRSWALELAQRWNAGTYSLFLLHGNIFDLHPWKDKGEVHYGRLQTFLSHRIFEGRRNLLYYDISEGLTFATPQMQERFFQWLTAYDQVENTSFHQTGPPKEFLRLVPLLRRFFLAMSEGAESGGVTLLIDFPEKIIPAAEEAASSQEERNALVSLLKWASSAELARQDVGIVLISETAGELHADLLQNPHIAQIRIDLPDSAEREQFIESRWLLEQFHLKQWSDGSELDEKGLSQRTSGLNLRRIYHLFAETLRNKGQITSTTISQGKKRLIEDYCQGLVRFKEPKPGVTLDRVASHEAAKQKLRELAWLIKNQKTEVLERGILVPGRVGVGKSFLIDCFASECGLPVLEMGDFRSKWVGDTERQQSRILMTIRALGPVIVVIDEADAVLGGRGGDGDSGVSSRVFAAFASHIGDGSLRGRELWIAMTSRPDLLAIDMKRQGRFGLCLPLFPAQGPEDVVAMFGSIAKAKKLDLSVEILDYVKAALAEEQITGSEVESLIIRAKERAVLAQRDSEVRLDDFKEVVSSFIDPLDPELIRLQNCAAILACSDRRYLPPALRDVDRGAIQKEFERLKR